MASLGRHLRLRRRRPGGFTVLEMMIALTISLVALAIATELILEAQRRLAHSGRRNIDMSVDLAFDQIRVDFRGSTGFFRPFKPGVIYYDGATDPLTTVSHFSGDVVLYELVDGDLRRVVYDKTNLTPKHSRLVLQNVSRFRWRPLPQAQTAIEVQLTYGETADLTRLVAAGQRERLTPKRHVVKMILVPRGLEFLDERAWW